MVVTALTCLVYYHFFFLDRQFRGDMARKKNFVNLTVSNVEYWKYLGSNHLILMGRVYYQVQKQILHFFSTAYFTLTFFLVLVGSFFSFFVVVVRIGPPQQTIFMKMKTKGFMLPCA